MDASGIQPKGDAGALFQTAERNVSLLAHTPAARLEDRPFPSWICDP